MTTFIETMNHSGDHFLKFAWAALWQSSLLIVILFVLEMALRRKVRAAIRYALWLMVFVKLLMPPSLALPTGLAWWLLPASQSTATAQQSPAKPQTTSFVTKPKETVSSVPLQSHQALPSVQPQFQPTPVPVKPRMSPAAWTLTASGFVSAGLLAWMLVRWWKINQKTQRATVSDKLISISNEDRCLTQAQRVTASEKLIPILGEVRRLTRLRSNIRLKLTEDSMSPAVCGLFRPVILLPQSLVEKLSAGQLRAVLLHEAIHIRRGDIWVNFAQSLLQIFYWWNPLLWLANARVRRIREEAVDDAVMLALRDDSEIYAPTLLEVAKLAFHRPQASLGLIGILESRSALRQRIERLVNFNAPKKAGLTIVSLLVILAFSAVALPMGEAPEKTNAPTASASNLTNSATASDVNTHTTTNSFQPNYSHKTVVSNQSAAEKLLGEHFFALQWISWEHYGRVSVTTNQGVWEIKGRQDSQENNDFITIDGVITEVNKLDFGFSGTIITKVSQINKGLPVTRSGAMTFSISGKRQYWRLKEMQNPAGIETDYVDVFFKKYDAPAGHYLAEEKKFKDYTIKTYGKNLYKGNEDKRFYEGCFEILRAGKQVFFKSGGGFSVSDKMGNCLTKDKQPNLVVSEYQFGRDAGDVAHIFQIGDTFKHIDSVGRGDSGLEFKDLRHDGNLEIVMQDCGTFVDWHACKNASPTPNVIFHYVSGKYLIDLESMKKPAPTDQELNKMAAGFKAAFAGETVSTNDVFFAGCNWAAPDGMWGAMLDLIYSGNMESAWKLCDLSWPEKYPGKEFFLKDFKAQLAKSPYHKDINQASFQGAASGKK